MNYIALQQAWSKFVCWLTVFALLQPYGLAANNPSEPKNASAPAPMKDIGWPRQISKNGSHLVYFQPQIDEWRDYKELFGRAAFSLKPSGGQQTMGVVSFRANTIVDKEARTAYLRDIELVDARFPSLDPQAVAPMTSLLKSLMPSGGETISMDRLIADMEKTKMPAARAVELKNDPPQIFYSATPAILLLVEGEPVLAPVEKTDLKFVVNTNWDLFFDKDNKRYYLLANGTWLTTKDLKGQWEPTQKLPKDMSKLPAKENFEDVKKFVPPPPPRGTVQKVFFSSKPAELITFNGAPAYTKIPGTELLYATNTENDLFVHNAEKQYYVLLSGRWFRARELSGPWSYAGGDLPADFSKIPRNSPRARVLASVPGTIEAADAVMLAQIPTTAVINKKEAEAKAKVTYDGGAPQFKPIEGTSMQYATNTPEKVVKVGDLYYLVFEGVWFVSKDPNGPWKTADSVPKEVYTIPPSSPVYNVTYVTQTNATDDTVESSYTAGYLGMFVVGMAVGTTIAYGTGWYYPPYYGGYYYGGYPVYRAYPATYGMGARYNPYSGRYGVGRSAYGPYGGVGSAASYNPSTGRYTRSATAQGYGGGRTVANSYNPWTGGYGQTRQGSNAYSQWGRTAAVRGDDWARTGHVSTARGTTGAYETSSGERGVVRSGTHGAVARGNNNVYAGQDGNVYRKDSGGNWSQYNNGNWNSVDNAQVQQAKDQASQARDQARQNLPQRDDGQSLSNSNLGSRTEGQSLGNSNLGSRSESRANVSSSTMQGLDSSAMSRDRGASQTQRYSSGRSGGGGMRSGGGFRGGGRRR
jgi:hypothetical protein